MIDLNKLVSDSLTKMQSEGKIEALIEKHLSEALNSVIRGLFEYSSDIRKELEKAFKEQIKVDLSQLTLPEYNIEISETDQPVQPNRHCCPIGIHGSGSCPENCPGAAHAEDQV